MVNGRWSLVVGRWSMVVGQWSMVQWPPDTKQQTALGHQTIESDNSITDNQ